MNSPKRNVTACPPDLGCLNCTAAFEVSWHEHTFKSLGKCVPKCTDKQLLGGCYPQFCAADGVGCTRCVTGMKLKKGFDGKATEGINNFSMTVRRLGQPRLSTPDYGPCEHAAHSKWVGHEDNPGAAKMNFFMYRAQSSVSYPPENVDLASAAGALWYLHSEVVSRKQSCNCEPGGVVPPAPHKCTDRHYSMTRILRYNVTVWNTVASGFTNFGRFIQFDKGQCTFGGTTGDHCKKEFKDHGYTVGCQKQPNHGGVPDQPSDYGVGNLWYSLPGACPELVFNDPNKKACAAKSPGGSWCGSTDASKKQSVDGTNTCTWSVEDAGEISLDDLAGIKDHQKFCDDGNYEYDDATDKGKGCTFWDNKKSKVSNLERVHKVFAAFAKKYPEQNNGLADPVCDTEW